VNQPIRRVALFCFLLIVSLLVSSNYIQVVNADSYKARPANLRNLYDQFSYPRGTITTADGTVIADSVPSGGINLKYMRTYPQGTAYANITGFKSISFGSRGVESQLNDFLNGNGGNLAVNNFLDTITGTSKKGGSVQLTIDNKVQQAAIAAMGGKEGSVVALDPATGAILAMYSNPTYDPNPVASNNGDTAAAAANALAANPAKPDLNHATSELYPPGSVFKVITAAAALDSGQYTETGPTGAPLDAFSADGNRLPNENGEICSDDTLKTALAQSCNSVYGSIGSKLGPATMAATAQKFGLNTTWGLDADGSTQPMAVAPSVFPTNLSANSMSLAQASIGQFDTKISPLQAAMIASAVANDGVLMKPYLVQKETSDRGSNVFTASPSALDTAMTSETATALQDMMVNVVQAGTGTNAKIPNVTVGGKTGTAQRTGQNPLAWFISYAKVNGKSVAVAVLVQDDQAKAQDISGGGLAAPVAKAVMQAALNIQ
jgi:penicillin-binding protein A